MKELKPVTVDVRKVKPLEFDGIYESRMILDHILTGRDTTIQINHGTLKAGAALDGSAHEDDEIYYILSGSCKLTLGDEVFTVHPDEVIFIPAGCFHALDNRESKEDLEILTLWRNWQANGAYQVRLERWGKSFKTIDED